MEKDKFYITTAIAYTSGKPHIGNTYEIVLADSIARFKRLLGYDVYFQTGTDEHGIKIQQKASEKGVPPQKFVDDVAAQIKAIWDMMNTTYDRFVRTTDPDHEKKIQKIFKKLYDQGDIYKGHYEGMYCTPCEAFFTEAQLVDGKCPDCGREVKKAKEEAYFFKMSKYADKLIKHIEENPMFIQPESRKNEMINNFLKPGLQDLCVSRTSFTWGIPVDFDPKHVVYVWVDALSNYITFAGYDPDGNSSEMYKKFWPADIHLIGKDILRFHTIYWPILLMALGEPLPKQVFGHPWLMVGDGKMSKSKGNVIYADDLISYFGVDAVRYYVLHEMPFASDGTLTYELMIERINSDLANILGNLVNRTIAMSDKYFEGVIQKPSCQGEYDEELISLALDTPKRVKSKMNELRIADAIDEIFVLLRRSNKYIDETTPWVLAKDPAKKERLGTVLYNLLESIRFAAVLLEPFLPETAQSIYKQLNTKVISYESLYSFDGMKAGDLTGKAEILFTRIDAEKKIAEIDEKLLQKEAPSKETQKEADETVGVSQISIEDFAKVELRVAKVLSCEPVPKSDKLLKLQLSVSDQTRQVVSGIAKYYKPEDLIGRNIILVYNLKPAKLRGVDSEGMILAADSDDTVKVIFADEATPGSKVR
ncbi:MAG: methionine--tRNA ligase [Clostridiales bacterium]|nr:methionine--tRNA ligase [Clostridiales bacterium]